MAIFGHRGAPPVVVPPSDGHGTGHPLESRQLSATRRLSRSLRRDHRRWCPVAKGAKLVNQKHQLGFVFSFQENLFWKGRNDRINSFFCESVMMSCDIIALVPLWISLCRTSPRLDFYFTTVSQHIFIWHMTVGKQGSQKSMLHGISNMISLNSIVAFPGSTCLLTLWISLRNEILSLFIWRISGDTEAFTREPHHLKCCSQQSR